MVRPMLPFHLQYCTIGKDSARSLIITTNSHLHFDRVYTEISPDLPGPLFSGRCRIYFYLPSLTYH